MELRQFLPLRSKLIDKVKNKIRKKRKKKNNKNKICTIKQKYSNNNRATHHYKDSIDTTHANENLCQYEIQYPPK